MVKQSPHLTQTSSVLLSCPFAATGSKHRPPQRACLLKVPLGRDSFSDFSWFSMPVTVLRRAGWSRVLRGAFLLECVGCFAEVMGLEEEHRGQVPFSSPHTEGTCWQPGVRLRVPPWSAGSAPRVSVAKERPPLPRPQAGRKSPRSPHPALLLL